MKEELSWIPSQEFLTIRKEAFFFLFLSLALHSMVAIFFYFYSIKEESVKPPLFARVVRPEEIQGLLSHEMLRTPVTRQKRNSTMPFSWQKPEGKTMAPPQSPGNFQEIQRPEDLIRIPEITSAPPVKDTPVLSRLFDKEIIKEKAKEDSVEEKISKMTFDTKEFKYQGYMNRLKEKIESIWQYPLSAAQRGIYGDLYIRFSIKKDGSLGRVQLIRTSGYRELDEAAMKALFDGAPYWPLPQEWGIDEFIIDGHFIYTLYGYYIR
ncbi:MAG: TonB family protein [Thermodesulfovibrionales bacterium]|nr:TonB family protein [Thermodesulfovibrionales bacterium]